MGDPVQNALAAAAACLGLLSFALRSIYGTPDAHASSFLFRGVVPFALGVP